MTINHLTNPAEIPNSPLIFEKRVEKARKTHVLRAFLLFFPAIHLK
jgi:hypothetical protein